MNRADIENRIEQLRQGLSQILTAIKQHETEIQKLIANKNATEGAIQDAEYWLNQFDKPEKKKKNEKEAR